MELTQSELSSAVGSTCTQRVEELVPNLKFRAYMGGYWPPLPAEGPPLPVTVTVTQAKHLQTSPVHPDSAAQAQGLLLLSPPRGTFTTRGQEHAQGGSID